MSDHPVTGRATARLASRRDLPDLERLYRLLAAEMEALRPVWPLTDGLPEPAAGALERMLGAADWRLILGLLESTPVGYLAWRDEPMLPQAGGERIAAVRYLFTEPEARHVGVGEAMVSLYLDEAMARGFRRFDAHLSPGHREAKNFFESNGFKARSIVMYRDDT